MDLGWITETFQWAGPWAGWLISGFLGTGLLFFYATDRIVTIGRHREQANHYQERIKGLEHQLGAMTEDRNYWRDVGVDLLNNVSVSLTSEDKS